MTSSAEPTKDVFVSYADDDREWVRGVLFNAFDEAGISYVDEEQVETALGDVWTKAIESALQSSRRVILVLSKEYRIDGFDEAIADMSRHLRSTRKVDIIPITRADGVALPTDVEMLIQLDMRSSEDWEPGLEKLRALLGKEVVSPRKRPPCPYPGMVPYSHEWSDRFFGRDEDVLRLLTMLSDEPLAVIIGPSGSGKSSLAQAGLFPELRKRTIDGDPPWELEVVAPGGAPMVGIARKFGLAEPVTPQHLAQKIGSRTEDAKLLLVIDQAEQMLGAGTSFPDAESQLAALGETLLLLQQHERVRTVLTVRSDFGPELSASPLEPALRGRYLRLGPMTSDGLRKAIVEPAELVEVFIDPSLVEAITKDAATEPGLLPFVQETMRMLWETIERRYLALENYMALSSMLVIPRSGYSDSPVSGLQVAMAEHARKVFAGLSDDEQTIAYRALIRLIQFVEGRSDVRRQQPMSALASSSDSPEDFQRVLTVLADGRLITTDSANPGSETATVDLSHEALISGWPPLASWVLSHRDLEVVRRSLRSRADDWRGLTESQRDGFRGRIAGFWNNYWRGDRLLDYHEIDEAENALADERAESLSVDDPDVVELVRVSKAWLGRRRAYFAVFLAVAVSAVVFGALAVMQGRRAENEANRATALLLAQAANADAEQQDLAVLLGLEAVVRLDSIETRSGLKTALELSPEIVRYLPSRDDPVLTVAVAPDGEMVALGGAGESNLVLISLDSPEDPVPLLGHREEVIGLAYSPDGHWLASASRDDTVRVWDVSQAETGLSHEIPAAEPSDLVANCRGAGESEDDRDVRAVAFDSTSGRLALGGHNGVVEVFTVGVWERTHIFEGHRCDVTDLAFHPNLPMLASSSRDGTVRLWNLDSSEEGLVIGEADQSANDDNDLRAVAWHTDGRFLAFSGNTRLVRLYDLERSESGSYLGDVVPTRHDERIFDLAFFDGGRLLASAAADRTINIAELGDPATGALGAKVLFGHRDAVRGLAATSDGLLVSGAQDGTVILWDPHRDLRLGTVVSLPGRTFRGIEYADGGWVAVDTDGRTTRIDTEGEILVAAQARAIAGEVRDIASLGSSVVIASSSGEVALTMPSEGQLRSWQAHDVRAEVVVGLLGSGLLVSGGIDEGMNGSHLRIWEPDSGRRTDQIFLEDCDIDHAALSPDETEIAVACNSQRSWLVGIEGDRFIGSRSPFADERLIVVAFAEGGQLYGGGEDGRLSSWDQSSGYRLAELVFDEVGDEIRAIALDETTMRGAAGTESGGVYLFDISTGRPIGEPWNVGLTVSDLAFSRQGTELAVVGSAGSPEESTMIILDVDEEEWQRAACEVAGRDLTEAEWRQLVGTDESRKPCFGATPAQ